MKFGNEILVEVATLHQPIALPGYGATDRTISQDKFKVIVMHLIPQGLHIEHNGIEYIIPHAAIGACKLAKVK
jgi:hypothetical protein